MTHHNINKIGINVICSYMWNTFDMIRCLVSDRFDIGCGEYGSVDIFREFKAYKYVPNRWRSIWSTCLISDLVNMNEHLRVGVWTVVTARRSSSHGPNLVGKDG